MNIPLTRSSAARVPLYWVRWCLYLCYFLSGFSALVFEVLWSRQFVTVFGNSAYAISIVLCAYMAGLGLGGWVGGKIADRTTRWTAAFGIVQMAVALWALVIPLLLDWLRMLVPTLPALSPDSLLLSTLTRFGLSFAVLLVPCFLMGTTLPLLARAVARSEESIAARIGALYCWNTFGAALGCLTAGFVMIDTFGIRLTNLLAVGETVLVAIAALALSRLRAGADRFATGTKKDLQPAVAKRCGAAEEQVGRSSLPLPAGLLLGAAFLNGLASLASEVLWVRYLGFIDSSAYVFPTILFVYLFGVGGGALCYQWFVRRFGLSSLALGILEMLLAVALLGPFVAGALLFAGGPPRPLGLTGMTFLTVLLPTVLMGMLFPYLCSVYGRQVQTLGRRLGLLFALNTAGTVLGSLLPVFTLVPALGIQRSLLVVTLLCGAMGFALLTWGQQGGRRLTWQAMMIFGAGLAVYLALVPSNLCERVFLSTDFDLARHAEVQFYREGRTGTAIVTRDRVNNCRTVYINGMAEEPALYGHELCFKLLGHLGPMLHPNPDDVLMICLGGGIAAGATVCQAEVKSLTIVDLESSVVEAARTLGEDNNDVLQDPRVRLVIDDGRNFLLMSQHKWPVILSDSTHPKSGDSWVLYTKEFYQLTSSHLTPNGIFVQWVPVHGLSSVEFKVILRTFQSVFPQTSLWISQGIDERGRAANYALLVATPGPLRIDVARLQTRLKAPEVRKDLLPYGLHTIAGFLDSFVCEAETLRNWVASGPINTDDLPYTQYKTHFSSGPGLDTASFIEPTEEIWRFLIDTGGGWLRGNSTTI
jgi:spermidine synthase